MNTLRQVHLSGLAPGCSSALHRPPVFPREEDRNLIADEPQKLVGMIAAVNCEFTDLGKKAFLFLARNLLRKPIELFQQRVHLFAIEDGVAIGVDVPQHGEARVSYGEHAIQHAVGL